MREIKFRMWSKKGKKMYDVGVIDFDDKKVFMTDYIGYTKSFFLIEEVEVMQYTGLKDKNGKEIYEGDIVKANWFDKEDVIGEICFSMGCFILANSSVSDNQLFIFKSYEVIGNIYENPELLKEE